MEKDLLFGAPQTQQIDYGQLLRRKQARQQLSIRKNDHTRMTLKNRQILQCKHQGLDLYMAIQSFCDAKLQFADLVAKLLEASQALKAQQKHLCLNSDFYLTRTVFNAISQEFRVHKNIQLLKCVELLIRVSPPESALLLLYRVQPLLTANRQLLNSSQYIEFLFSILSAGAQVDHTCRDFIVSKLHEILVVPDASHLHLVLSLTSDIFSSGFSYIDIGRGKNLGWCLRLTRAYLQATYHYEPQQLKILIKILRHRDASINQLVRQNKLIQNLCLPLLEITDHSIDTINVCQGIVLNSMDTYLEVSSKADCKLTINILERLRKLRGSPSKQSCLAMKCLAQVAKNCPSLVYPRMTEALVRHLAQFDLNWIQATLHEAWNFNDSQELVIRALQLLEVLVVWNFHENEYLVQPTVQFLNSLRQDCFTKIKENQSKILVTNVLEEWIELSRPYAIRIAQTGWIQQLQAELISRSGQWVHDKVSVAKYEEKVENTLSVLRRAVS